MKNVQQKNGGILVMVMVVLLAVSLLVIGFFRMRSTNAVETVYVEQSNQAFWIAESGIQRALHKLRTDTSFRTSPYFLTEAVGGGMNYVGVTVLGADRWSIASTGTVHSMTRIITLDPQLTAEVGYAIMGLNGDSTLNNNGSIDGNVYNYGDIDVNGRAAPNVNGEVLALDMDNMDFTPLTENDQIEMGIDSNYSGFDLNPSPSDPISYIYQDLDGDGTSNKYINLTGPNPVVVNSDLDIEADLIGTYGDGTLVVNGTLDFRNSVITLEWEVNDGATILVRDGIFAQKDGHLGSDVIIYTEGDMKLQKTGTGDSTTLLVKGDLTVDMNLDFNGLIFVDGEVQVDGNLTLEGSLIAGSGFWLKREYTISYNPDHISQDVLDNMILYVVYATSPGTWNEIPVL